MVAAEKPHIGCMRVPFMNSTTRSDSMSDSIRDCNGGFSCIGLSSDRARAVRLKLPGWYASNAG